MREARHGLLYRLGDMVVRAGLWIAVLSVATMMILITAEIVARGFFGISFMIVDEVSGYLLLAMTFLGAAYSLRCGALLRIEFILSALSRRGQAVAGILFNSVALALTLLLFWYLLSFTMSTWNRGMVAPTLSAIPLWIPQLFMPLGCFVLAVGLLLELFDSIARARGRDAGQRHMSGLETHI